jgi:hypothetical protein
LVDEFSLKKGEKIVRRENYFRQEDVEEMSILLSNGLLKFKRSPMCLTNRWREKQCGEIFNSNLK